MPNIGYGFELKPLSNLNEFICGYVAIFIVWNKLFKISFFC